MKLHKGRSLLVGLFASVAAATVLTSGPTYLLAQDKPAGEKPEGGERRGGEGRPRRDGPGREGPGREGAAQGPNLEGAMKLMNRAARQLKDSISDASKKDENLKLITDIERGCIGAKGAPLPQKLLDKAADDNARKKLQADFRADLIKLLRLSLDIEQDIIDGKNDAAKTKFDQLQKLRDESHKAMGVKEEKEGGEGKP